MSRKHFSPDTYRPSKLIALFRNPIDRTYSFYNHFVRYLDRVFDRKVEQSFDSLVAEELPLLKEALGWGSEEPLSAHEEYRRWFQYYE